MSPSESTSDRPTEPEPDHREDVYVAFSMNEVARTQPTVGTFGEANVDYDHEGKVVGLEILNALYVEVNGIRIEK